MVISKALFGLHDDCGQAGWLRARLRTRGCDTTRTSQFPGLQPQGDVL